MKLCPCVDPENCTQNVPGYICRKEAGVCGKGVSDTPVKSRFPMTLNALREMQQSPAYAVRKDVLVCAEEAIVQLERELAEAKRDAERIDWMEKRYASGFVPALVVDDEGKWAYTEDGISSLGSGCREVCALVMPEEWRNSAREAIDAAMKEREK